MIYSKESNFPYPILSNFTSDYTDKAFTFDVNLYDENDKYKFVFDYNLESYFIRNLIVTKKAKLFVIFESIDSIYFELNEDKAISIKKNRISLSKKTRIQLFVISVNGFNLLRNFELDSFYDDLKDKIFLKKYNVLAMSNIVQFDGDLRKPFDIFLKQYDPNIPTDMQFMISEDMIIIKYRDKDYQYNGFQAKSSLNNHYVYIGLQKALMRFYYDLSDDGDDLFIDEMEEPNESGLYKKLFYLLKVKGIKSVNIENIDDVIEKISDRILHKHYIAVKRVSENAG